MTLTGGPLVTTSGGAAVPLRKGRPRDERIDEDITSAALDLLVDRGVRPVHGRGGGRARRRREDHGLPSVPDAERPDRRRAPATQRRPARRRRPPGRCAIGSSSSSTGIRRRTTESVRGRILMQVVSEGLRDPDARRRSSTSGCSRRADRCCATIIADGIASGELRADVEIDTVVPVLVGPMLYLGMWGSARGHAGRHGRVRRRPRPQRADVAAGPRLSALTPATGS